MSYLGQKHGYIEGLGAAFTLAVSEGLRSIQEDLQRLGLLDPGTGPTGADGRWGANTSVAIGTAAMRMGYTGAPVAVTNGGRNITIADDFIAALHRVAISGFPTTTVRAPDVSTTPSTALPTTVITPDVEESPGWLPWVVGGSLLAAIGIATMFGGGVAAIRTNRRRFRRNARRRRR